MTFCYVRLEQAGSPLGMLTFQVKEFNPGESLKKHARKGPWQWIRYRAASLFRVRVLCLGNTTVTGDYGFCFSSTVTPRDQTLLMMQCIDWMLTLPNFRKIGLVFVKDFYRDIFRELQDTPYCRKYHVIDTQPSMIMHIRPEWKNFDDYLAALKSKYRVRAKKAMQSAQSLERVELNLDEIRQVEDHLHYLYLQVVGDAGFNLFYLPPKYFSTIKRAMGDSFRLWVYKDHGEIISFFTLFEDGDIMDAHFLGYDPEVNHYYKLYLNMLLALIGEATQKGFRQLQLSRTATEIKSSVGADGLPVWAYLRYPNRILNSILPWIYSFFKPDLSWEPREPFTA